MKKILGLDLGTTSIGWALVNEAENEQEKSSIIKLGVRVNPLTVDEQQNFEKGKSITTNADRTLKRTMRRNLQRYKLRRDNLIDCLKQHGMITAESILSETGNATTFQTYRLRAKAATEEVSLEDLSRILLMLNKKRGYKSSRKAKGGEDGQLIDGMGVAKELYEKNITPGQYVLGLLRKGKKYIPDFYRSDLINEYERVWDYQSAYYAEILTPELKEQLRGKTKKKTSDTFYAIYKIASADNKGKDRRLQQYKWRSEALERKLTQEELVYVLSDINGAVNNSSGYLGAISDRSKELFFKQLTIGQYLMQHLSADCHYSIKNKTFYRQDYLDEFERIWETQSAYHPQLTPELKHELRDIIIFYQRPLKSKKSMIDVCTFENRKVTVIEDGKTRTKVVGLKCVPKASPLFQEFKIWQILNNIEITNEASLGPLFDSEPAKRPLDTDEMRMLAYELQYKDKLKGTDILKLLFGKAAKNYSINYKEVEGNRTVTSLTRAYMNIVTMSGHNEYDIMKMTASEIEEVLGNVFSAIGIDTDILTFDSSIAGKAFEQQPMYRLWHLLYSYEGDDSPTGNETLIRNLNVFGFEREYAAVLANVAFQDDYGSLSAKAIRRILPFMKEGNDYYEACSYAGYKHSERSREKEELLTREYKSQLELLPRNSLRNPVVEKILNQMINVVNAISLTYGKPDEIRIELARELKKNAKERANMVQAINEATSVNEKYRVAIQKEFGKQHVSRNDILRYKLYMELKDNGFKTLYSNTYIPKEKLFSKEFDIEHIIPQARLFDDSFSNKTLEVRSVNIDKSNDTAYEFILTRYGEEAAKDYVVKIDTYYKKGAISKAKRDKLLMRNNEIPSDFIDRDLRNSQYIAKKAREILEEMVMFVNPTVGSITDRLREDWQLVDVMQELNWDKYAHLGLIETYVDNDGNEKQRIKDWTKRNDHRHHAMDALTIAFTKLSIVQYLNNLNARSDKSGSIYAIEQKELYRDKHGKLRFCPPMPLDEFRAEAKHHLCDILVSIKAKNKVMTQNVNKTKRKNGTNKKVQLTPRGQLHNETIYGHTRRYVTSEVAVGSKMTAELIAKVAKKLYREALMARLAEYDGDAKKAFTGKNSLEKNPLWLNAEHSMAVPLKVKIVEFEDNYPIRKAIDKDLKVEKVMDKGVRRILEARLAEYGGDANKAFSNLEENPIWLNEEKGIALKRVRVRGVLSAIPLHHAKDNNGQLIKDVNDSVIPVDYVQTSGTHHVAIYRDNEGKLQDVVVSFYEATVRKSLGIPVVDKEYKSSEGWKFLFSMKQNEYFVFPDKEKGFIPDEMDLTLENNLSLVSKYMYRVQYLSKVDYGNTCVRDYCFRHHLETHVEYPKPLQGVTWKKIKSLPPLEGIVKVRVNHIGQIVSVGEY